MPHDFACRPGECIQCCTISDTIPVTIGDLCRIREYGGVPGERAKTLYQVYSETCDGWFVIHSPPPVSIFERIMTPYSEERTGGIFSDRASWRYWPIPKSKKPCPNLDADKKICKGHDERVSCATKYITCYSMPELCLVPEAPGRELHEFSDLVCLEDATLSPEKLKRIFELDSQLTTEISTTFAFLGYGESGWTRSQAGFAFNEDELDSRMRDLGARLEAYLRRVEQNEPSEEGDSILVLLLLRSGVPHFSSRVSAPVPKLK